MARKIRANAGSTTRPTPAPVQVRKPHSAAWMLAKMLAKDDITRLRTQSDGFVIVLNFPGQKIGD